MTSFGETFAQKLIASRLIYRKNVRGFTAQEVQNVMDAQGVKCLPKTYSNLLAHAGHGIQVLFLGDACSYQDLLELKGELKTTMSMDEKHKDQFPEDAFVFVTHLASSFAWFLTDIDDDDPPVYQYHEGDYLKITHSSLSEFFEKLLEDNIKFRDKLERKQNEEVIDNAGCFRPLF